MTEQTPATPEFEAPYSAEAAAPQPKKGGAGKIIGIVVGVVIVAVIGLVAVFGLGLLTGASPANAKVGACLTDAPKVEDVKVVDCAAAEAKYKVLSVLEDKTEAQALEECQKVEGAEGYLVSYTTDQITAASKGRVLCTGPTA